MAINSILLNRLNKTLAEPNQIHTYGNKKCRPLQGMLDAGKKLAILSIIATSLSGQVVEAGSSSKKSEFDVGYREMVKNEGYSLSIDMPVKRGKKVVGYKRTFEACLSDLEIVRNENEILLKNIKNGATQTINSSDIHSKAVVATYVGIDSRSHGDVLDYTDNQIKQFYKANFWPEKLLKVSGSVARIAFDIGVNHGVQARNEMLAKVAQDLANYEINPKIGLSSADIAVLKGISEAHPGAIEWGFAKYAKEHYDELIKHEKHRQNAGGWLSRQHKYEIIAGEQGKAEYESLFENANRGREALLADSSSNDALNSDVISDNNIITEPTFQMDSTEDTALTY